VNDIDLNLSLAWLGNATMNIGVTVQNNNQEGDYQGYLRVYVTETVSSLGWGTDAQGDPYAFAFLDYAFDESVFVGAGGLWQDSTIWNGNYHSNGLGVYFRNITPDNITIIAAVFDTTWHQGYSYPPSSYPFDAYYVDEAAAIWINYPPDIPSDPVPGDSAVAINPSSVLRWSGGDPNFFDDVTYDVYFGETNPPAWVRNQSSTSYNPGTLDFGTTYYWQIVSQDQDTSVNSPLWSFTTIARGDCNAEGEVNISDVIYLINYLFRYGPSPTPTEVGNVDCDSGVTVSDAIYLINYFFKGGPPPGDPDGDGTPDC
jgi:hypothetical protein